MLPSEDKTVNPAIVGANLCVCPEPLRATSHERQATKYPLDFSPLSAYFINTFPAVLRVTYRFSGAALLNTYSDTYCGVNTRYEA
jgi:hypothetical protein